jgi:hypothetical protein
MTPQEGKVKRGGLKGLKGDKMKIILFQYYPKSLTLFNLCYLIHASFYPKLWINCMKEVCGISIEICGLLMPCKFMLSLFSMYGGIQTIIWMGGIKRLLLE